MCNTVGKGQRGAETNYIGKLQLSKLAYSAYIVVNIAYIHVIMYCGGGMSILNSVTPDPDIIMGCKET